MSEPPFLLIIAGPNGSGKTTLIEQLRREDIDFGRHINPDEIAKTLQGSYADRVRRAQALADAARSDCLADLQSFSFETVMSHPSKIDVMRIAHEKGFRTMLFFVATESPDLNVLRVQQRVQLNGHDVPEDRVRQRYFRTLALLPEAMACVDEVLLYDNTYVLRPFFLRRGEKVQVAPPVPQWARDALFPWLAT